MRAKCWLGTWNNYPEDWKVIISTSSDYYIAQLEEGDTGNIHIQFAVKFINARTFECIQRKYVGAHIEKARNWNACVNYCQKERTYRGERITKLTDVIVNDPLDGKIPNDLQMSIIDIINQEPDDRTIHWFADEVGGKGKTTLAKHLCITRKDVLYISGKSADMKYGVSCWVKNKPLNTVIIDLSRSIENFVSYQGIEEVKNGIFYNTKYESEMIIFNNPHVIVLANFLPDKDKLSEDRWHITIV